jgi:hypothetical protein
VRSAAGPTQRREESGEATGPATTRARPIASRLSWAAVRHTAEDLQVCSHDDVVVTPGRIEDENARQTGQAVLLLGGKGGLPARSDHGGVLARSASNDFEATTYRRPQHA